MWVQLAFDVFGGLGLFLFGMQQMTNGLQAIAGDSMRRIINLLTTNRFAGLAVGLVITGIIQSSSVTSVMVVGFVNAGLMNITQAISVIMGANIGTTVTGWIIAINVTKYALPMLAVGVAFHLFARSETLRLYGQTLLGLGLVFFGLLLMKNGFAPLKDSASIVKMLQAFGAATLPRLLLTILVGTLVTMVIQSSSAFIGIIMAMASTGLITFPTCVALVLAANIGTTITAQLAAIGANVHARRAARAHLLFNLIGVVLTVFVFHWYVDLIDWIVPHDPDFVSGDGGKPHIMTHIAMATTVFNVAMVVILLPLVHQLSAFATWLVPKRGKDEVHLALVDKRLLQTPSLAVEQAYREVVTMSDSVREMLTKGTSLFQRESGRTTFAREIFTKENYIDEFQKEITIFLSNLLQAALTQEESEETRVLLRISDELESIGDYAENLAKCYMRTKKNEEGFSADAAADLERISRHVVEYFDLIVKAFHDRDRTILPEARSRGDTINHIADEIRENHLNRLDAGVCDPVMGLVYSDIVVNLRRVKNHTFNIAEAVTHWR